MTPTARTLQLLRDSGATHVEKVEYWNPFSKTRKDFLGFADIITCMNHELIAVQTTTLDHIAHRREKIRSCRAASCWLECGGKIWIIGWGQAGEHNRSGLKSKTWYHKVEEVKLPQVQVNYTDN